MYFLSKWILIIFTWGGIGLTIKYLIVIDSRKNFDATLDLKKFKKSLQYLIVFILLLSVGFLELFIRTFGEGGFTIQFINNLAVGAVFVAFLSKLWSAITFRNK